MRRNISKTTLIAALSLCLACSLLISGCSRGHKITVASGQDLIDECPKSARPGDTVTITTALVEDAVLYLSINGNQDFGAFIREGVYEFIMPDEDVQVDVWVVSNGLA